MWILAPPAWPHREDQPHSATARGAQACVQHLMGKSCRHGVLGELHHPLWAEMQEGSMCQSHHCSRV